MQFKDVVGQGEVKQRLIQEIITGKISHAQLFAGKSGFGTLPLALAFVQYLYCENKSETDSCGSCPSCSKVEKLEHPDLHFAFPIVLAIEKTSDAFMKDWRAQVKENHYFDIKDWVRTIDPKSERSPVIGTEQSAEIIKKLTLKSYEGNYKVMIIWGADEMNTQCANKLLKILEEPPEKTLFLLLTEHPDRLLTTIISRTQLIKIPKIDNDHLAQSLRSSFQITKDSEQSVLSRSEGNLIEAERLLAAVDDHEDNRLLFVKLMRVCYKKDVLEMLNWSDEAALMGRERLKQFIDYSLHMIRQSLLRNYTEDQLTRVSDEENEFLKNFAKFITGNNVFDFMNHFNDCHYHLERNANAKLLLNDLCFNVMRYIHKA
ncbi:MAG: DNA polymerase III subunit delta' [Bacteroidota bacterium]